MLTLTALTACHVSPAGSETPTEAEEATPAAGTGDATFEGSPPGHTLAATGTAYYFPFVRDDGQDSTFVILAEVPWSCAELSAWLADGTNPTPDAGTQALVTLDLTTWTEGEITGGTILGVYGPVPEDGPEDGQAYTASGVFVGDLDAIYDLTAAVYIMSSGSAEILAHTAQERLEGTLDMIYDDGAQGFRVQASFAAAYCPQ